MQITMKVEVTKGYAQSDTDFISDLYQVTLTVDGKDVINDRYNPNDALVEIRGVHKALDILHIPYLWDEKNVNVDWD